MPGRGLFSEKGLLGTVCDTCQEFARLWGGKAPPVLKITIEARSGHSPLAARIHVPSQLRQQNVGENDIGRLVRREQCEGVDYRLDLNSGVLGHCSGQY